MWEDLLEVRDKIFYFQVFLGKGGLVELGIRGGVIRISFLNLVKIVYGGIRMRLVIKVFIICCVGFQVKKNKFKENNMNSG